MNLSFAKNVWKLKIRKQIKNTGDYVFNMWNIIVNENYKSSIQAKIFKYLEFQIRQFGRNYKLYFIYYLQLLLFTYLCIIQFLNLLFDNAVCVCVWRRHRYFCQSQIQEKITSDAFISGGYIKKNHRILLKKINCYVWHGSFYLWVFVYIYWKWLKCFFPHFDTVHMI